MILLTFPRERCACVWLNCTGTPEWHLQVRHPGCPSHHEERN